MRAIILTGTADGPCGEPARCRKLVLAVLRETDSICCEGGHGGRASRNEGEELGEEKGKAILKIQGCGWRHAATDIPNSVSCLQHWGSPLIEL